MACPPDTRQAGANEMFAVVLHFFNGFVDVRQRLVFARLPEPFCQPRPPALGQFLQCADVEVATMQVSLQLRGMWRPMKRRS